MQVSHLFAPFSNFSFLYIIYTLFDNLLLTIIYSYYDIVGIFFCKVDIDCPQILCFKKQMAKCIDLMCECD